MNAITNRPTEAQAFLLRQIEHSSVLSALHAGKAYNLCKSRKWLDDAGITATGKVALASLAYALTGKEVETLEALVGGPLFWGTRGFWRKAPSRDPEGAWYVWTKTVHALSARGLVILDRKGSAMVLADDAEPGVFATISATGLDALGVIAPVPLSSGFDYRGPYKEGSGPKLYGWLGTPAPGWRPGLAAPDVLPPPEERTIPGMGEIVVPDGRHEDGRYAGSSLTRGPAR